MICTDIQALVLVNNRVCLLQVNSDKKKNLQAAYEALKVYLPPYILDIYCIVESGSSAVNCRTRNQVSPGSNPPLLPFRRLGIFVLSIDAPVDSAV